LLLVQSEVAQAIAGEIQVALTPEETSRLAGARSINPEAHEAYLRGRFHSYQFTPADLEKALEYFESALQKDPDYALAYVGIGNVWTNRLVLGAVPPLEAGPRGLEAVSKAMELDSSLAEAHGALANLRTWHEWDWVGAEPAFQRAIELNPNYADARLFYGHFLTAMKRPEEARAQMERAMELDPLNSFYQGLYGWHLTWVERYDEAIGQFRGALRTSPNFPLPRFGLWNTFHKKGMHEEAVTEVKAFFAGIGDREVEEAMTRGYGEAGYTGALSLAAETIAARSQVTYEKPYIVATLYAWSGNKEKAFEWLERSFEARDHDMAYLSVHPLPDSVRDDPRFQALLRRMKLPF
jgi:Tfp pilus assembly protein PilF